MNNINIKDILLRYKRRLLIFLAVFGPATISAVADNDAAGVATYSVAGARLGYPILFVLMLVTPLLAITQEMGIRLALISRKGLGDLIRENYGIKVSLFIFLCLFTANTGTIIADLSAIKISSEMLSLPSFPFLIIMIVAVFLFTTKGSYKMTQNIMLFVSLFYLTYIFSAIQAKPDWKAALTNLFIPNGIPISTEYLRDYLFIGMSVLGTTITPWGQFFISSFAFDKKIAPSRLKYAQIETYWGAFLTDFFSFFMIVATAATLFTNGIILESGEQAAMAIKPFAGELAGLLFALGILNAGFMGVVVISLTTAYAFSEFFGFSGSLDASFEKSRLFYIIFLVQLTIAAIATMMPGVSLFQLAIITQTINAIMLPLVFYYLISLTSNKEIMGSYINSDLKKYFAIAASVLICITAVSAVFFTLWQIIFP